MGFGRIEHILDLLFPPKCICCDAPGGLLCERCAPLLQPYQGAAAQPDDALSSVVSAFEYRGAAPDAIKAFKFYGHRYVYDRLLHACFLKCVRNAYEGVHIDALVPVPMTARALRKRGFNHAEYIARRLSRDLGIPCEPRLLQKLPGGRIQHTLSLAERQKNVKGLFCLAPGKEAAGKSFVVIDDIRTSGATMRECAMILKSNGARLVCGAAVMQTPERKSL